MLHTGVSLARRATESLELRIFDVEEGMESEGRRPEEDWRMGENGSRFPFHLPIAKR